MLKPLHIVQPVQPSRLESLKSGRATLAAEIAKLADGQRRLADTENHEREAQEAIDSFAAADTAAMVEWASAGAVGDPPQPDMKQRAILAKALVEAQAAAAVARAAIADLGARQSMAASSLDTFDRRIAEACFDELESNFNADMEGLHRQGVELRARVAYAAALHEWFVSQAEDLRSKGEAASAQALFYRAEKMQSAKVDTVPTNGEVRSQTPAWAERFAALMKGDA